MNHSFHQNKEELLKQLVYIDENIQELTELYIASTPVQERIKNFYHLYTLEVEDLLKQNKGNRSVHDFPKVFIGTKVTVLYEDDDETEDYVICFPEQSNPDEGYISFLSPVGKQLLLRKIGENISLKIPTGSVSVTIKEISFGGSLMFGQKQIKEA
ncbi:GreA/GreB family elongation factor [Bacillus marasmi]|uniref:GreA/GreB family elongation factor n=1 Tax=Bacillus marasmi TaxID=1926279 RepID=UPI0011CAFCAC|nr:GreA/GreB family elongation factor [Bacillus marasmi]